MTYTKPQDVKSPRESWTLLEVLMEGEEDTHALAVGEWEGERRLAIRWNGTDERPAGNPQSRGVATWFILPPDYDELLVDTLPERKRTLARLLLNLGQEERR